MELFVIKYNYLSFIRDCFINGKIICQFEIKLTLTRKLYFTINFERNGYGL